MLLHMTTQTQNNVKAVLFDTADEPAAADLNAGLLLIDKQRKQLSVTSIEDGEIDIIPVSGAANLDWYSVVDYGAKPDGTSGDAAANTAAIQAAVDAIPSTGGVLYFPAGHYYVNDVVTLKNYLYVLGAQAQATTIEQVNTAAGFFQATDALHITMERMTLRSGTTGTATAAIHFIRSTRTSNYITLRDLEIINFSGDGIRFDDTIVTTLENVIVNTVKGHGFNVLSTTTVSTSVSFIGTYAVSCDQAGYNLKNCTYISLHGTASDLNGIGYLVDSSSGVTFNSCGVESCRNVNGTYNAVGYKITGSTSVVVNCGYSFDNTNIAFYVTGNSSRIAFLECREVGPNASAVNSFKVDSGSSRVSIMGKNFSTATSLSVGTTNFPLSYTTLTKTADQFVTNSTTLVNDNTLFATVDANSTYLVEANIKYNASTTGNIKIGWTGPSGATLEWTINGVDIAAAATSGSINRLSGAIGTVLTAAGAGSNMWLLIRGTLVVGATAGTLQLQFAQNALDAGVSTSIRATSTLTVKQVA